MITGSIDTGTTTHATPEQAGQVSGAADATRGTSEDDLAMDMAHLYSGLFKDARDNKRSNQERSGVAATSQLNSAHEAADHKEDGAKGQLAGAVVGGAVGVGGAGGGYKASLNSSKISTGTGSYAPTTPQPQAGGQTASKSFTMPRTVPEVKQFLSDKKAAFEASQQQKNANLGGHDSNQRNSEAMAVGDRGRYLNEGAGAAGQIASGGGNFVAETQNAEASRAEADAQHYAANKEAFQALEGADDNQLQNMLDAQQRQQQGSHDAQRSTTG